MSVDQIIGLTRHTLQAALWASAPMLIIGMLISLLVSLFQVLTSMQDATLSAVPRLIAVAAAAFFLAPWMLQHLAAFTVQLLGDLHPYVR